MNKKRLIELIQQPEKINQKDVQELEDLVREYPYFQNAYFLIAKGNRENKSLNTSASVQRAAVFAPDRTHLKKFLDGTLKTEIKESVISPSIADHHSNTSEPITQEANKNTQEPVFEFNLKPSELISFDNTVVEKNSSENLIDEIHANLKKLQDTREELESAEKDFDKIQSKKKVAKPTASPKEQVKEVSVKASVKTSKKLSENPEKESKAVTKKPQTPKAKEPEKVSEKPKAEKKEDKPKAEKKSPVKNLPKEEQIKIIEQFIESSPQIPKVSHGTVPEGQHTDLSSQLKYDMEDFITENLAVIMEKQGKTEKAIEIYNKLIWKFPQKKAYFATQIEKLKK